LDGSSACLSQLLTYFFRAKESPLRCDAILQYSNFGWKNMSKNYCLPCFLVPALLEVQKTATRCLWG